MAMPSSRNRLLGEEEVAIKGLPPSRRPCPTPTTRRGASLNSSTSNSEVDFEVTVCDRDFFNDGADLPLPLHDLQLFPAPL